MRRSGPGSLLLALVLLTGCGPVRYGFVGGGLPSHIRTVAVLPFDNQTPSPDLQRELHERMRDELQARLGLREASEQRADAIVRGTILRYDTDVPIGFSADPRQATSARRRLQLAVDVEIVDQTTGRTLWQRRNLVADGDYDERAETQGRQRAIEKLVADMIDGAQSQW
ncbi:MAG TPA: LptE family protein [Gemmatimonadaceae bacterium]|nr:LptE family protein [Gemmatimonadaceae bacterium]